MAGRFSGPLRLAMLATLVCSRQDTSSAANTFRSAIDELPVGAVAQFRVVYPRQGPMILRGAAPVGDAREQSVRSLVLTPDCNMIIGYFGGVPVVAWDAKTAKELYRLWGADMPCRIALSGDGKILALGQAMGGVYLLDSATRKSLAYHAPQREQLIKSLSFSSDGKLLVTISVNDIARWDVSDPKASFSAVKTESTESAAASLNGDHFAISDYRGRITAFDLKGGNVVARPRPVDTNPDASGKNVGPPNLEAPLTPDPRIPGAIAITNDGQRLAIALQDATATLRLVDAGTGRDIYRKSYRSGSTRIGSHTWMGLAALAISPDDRFIVIAGHDGRIDLLRSDTGASVGTFDGLVPSVMNPFVSYTRDGRYLLSDDGEGHIIIWDAAQRVVDGRLKPRGLSDAELAKAWEDLLVGQQTLATYSAAWSLASEGARTAAFLRGRLLLLPDDDPKAIASLAAELGDDRPAVREKAATELRKRGQLADTELRRLLAGKPNAEAKRRAEQILSDRVARADVERQRLAIAILRCIDAPEATKLLDDLKTKHPGTWLSDAIGKALTEQRK